MDEETAHKRLTDFESGFLDDFVRKPGVESYFPLFDEFALSETELALATFLMRLDFVGNRVRLELRGYDDELRRYMQLGEFIRAEFEAASADAEASGANIIIYTPAVARAEIEETSARMSAECCAGSAIMMLDDVFQRLRQEVWNDSLKQPKKSAFRIGRARDGSTSTLIYAAGNAYRHLRDWGNIVKRDGSCDIESLDKNVRETVTLLKEGVDLVAVYRNLVCCSVLDVLCGHPERGRSFDNLLENLESAALDFASQYCDGEISLERVRKAIDYQSDISSMEISYTNNDVVFDDKR